MFIMRCVVQADGVRHKYKLSPSKCLDCLRGAYEAQIGNSCYQIRKKQGSLEKVKLQLCATYFRKYNMILCSQIPTCYISEEDSFSGKVKVSAPHHWRCMYFLFSSYFIGTKFIIRSI